MNANNHEFEGRVLAKSQKYPVGSNGMVKSFLYLEGDYIVAGKPRVQQVKFTCFSFQDNRSRIDDVLPGDVVKFMFTLSGFFKPEEKDYLGAPKLFIDAVIDSKVEIIDQSNRKLYDNEPKGKDDMGVFAGTPPVLTPLPVDDSVVDDPYDSGLPF